MELVSSGFVISENFVYYIEYHILIWFNIKLFMQVTCNYISTTELGIIILSYAIKLVMHWKDFILKQY